MGFQEQPGDAHRHPGPGQVQHLGTAAIGAVTAPARALQRVGHVEQQREAGVLHLAEAERERASCKVAAHAAGHLEAINANEDVNRTIYDADAKGNEMVVVKIGISAPRVDWAGDHDLDFGADLGLLAVAFKKAELFAAGSCSVTQGGERLTLSRAQSGAQVAVQGRTVSILGSLAAIEAAQVSVGMLLGGAEHGSVYHYLEGHRRGR